MAARVVVVGSANMDLVVRAPSLPRPGETVLGHDFAMVPGGKGANQAIAAARAGAECTFVGAVGQDAFGKHLREALAGSGVDVRRLRTVPGPSGVAVIAVDDLGENVIVVAPGANAAVDGLTDADLAAVAGADVLLCQMEIPLTTVAQAAAAARSAGATVILNAAPARALPPELIGAVDLLVVNQVEAPAMVGRALPPAQLLEQLLAAAPRAVLTLGAEGAAYADRDDLRVEVRAPRVTAVDTTAAGDAFSGALAVAWAERLAVPDALRWACAAGAVCTERPGASPSLPTRAEIEARAGEDW